MHDATTGMSILRYLQQVLIALALVSCAAGTLTAATADQQYALAASHYQNGRWQLAIAEFEVLLKEHPQHRLAGEAAFFVAEAAIQLGQYEQAAQRLDAFVRDHAGHAYMPQAHFRRGECDYFRGCSAEAREQFQSFAKHYPRHELLEFALPYLGELCLTAGDVAQAEANYQQALQKFPAGRMADQCRFGLAQALEAQGDEAAAERFYRFLIDKSHDGLGGDARLRLAALLIRGQRTEEAVERLEEVLLNDKQSQWHAEANYLLLKTRYDQRNWAEVAAVHQRAFAERPDAAHLGSAIFLTAQAHCNLGQTDLARKLYRQAIENHTDPVLRNDSLIELFSLEMAAGQMAEAEKALAKLTQLAEHDPRLKQLQRIWLAHEIAAGRYDSAKSFLNVLSPRHTERLGSELEYFAALIELGQQNYEAALALLNDLNSAELPAETKAPVQFARATALMKLERYGEAIGPLQSYLADNAAATDAPLCREYLVLAHAHEQNWNAAETALEALRHDVDQQRTNRTTGQLAGLALADNQLDLARRMYQDLAASDSHAPEPLVRQSLAALAWLDRNQTSAAPSPALTRLLAEHADSSEACAALLDAAKGAAAKGQATIALAGFHRLVERFPETPAAAESLLGAALIYDGLAQHAEAEALWSLLVRHPAGDSYRDAALYNLAWSLLQQEREEEAYEHLATLSNEHCDSPYWVDATLRLAQREHAQQRSDEAQSRLKSVLEQELTPAVAAHAYYLQGTLAAEQQAWPEVAQAMRRVRDAGEQQVLYRPASYWQAEALYQLRDYEQAEAQFAALADGTSSGEEWEAMIPLRQAQCLAHRKQWGEAEALASSIAERFPQFAQQYETDYLLGRCLAAQGRMEEARAAYEQAVAAPLAAGTETAAMASWMIGETHFHGKQYDEALRAYYRTAELSAYPVWRAAALLQAGKCHEVQGDWDKAALRYRELLAISPPTRFHADAEQRYANAQRRTVARSESNESAR